MSYLKWKNVESLGMGLSKYRIYLSEKVTKLNSQSMHIFDIYFKIKTVKNVVFKQK